MPSLDPSHPLDGIPLLLVEDDDIARRTAAIVLRGLGGTMLESIEDGDAFAARCRAGLAGLVVLTDLQMPGAHPVDTLLAVPAAQRPRGVIILSGDTGLAVLSQRDRLLEAGVPMLGLIEKPMTPAKLRALLSGQP